MRRILWAAVAISLLVPAALVSASQLVSVEIESFRSWGVLRWGTWEPMEARLLSSRITALPEADARSLDVATRACATVLQDADRGACDVLQQIQAIRETRYSVQALLGRPYRVRIRNLTPGTLGVVLAIDGLNTYGNQPIADDASDAKWILRPFQEVTLSGWQISATEALRFEFAAPSRSHSDLDALRGIILVSVYADDPLATAGERGTQAGALIAQPTVVIPFASATRHPVETHQFDYSRDRVVLGIQCEDTDGAGIRVTAVVDGTAARLAGLRAGDVITYINAVPINSCSQLQSFLATRRPGDRVVLKVHRPDRVFLVTVELEE